MYACNANAHTSKGYSSRCTLFGRKPFLRNKLTLSWQWLILTMTLLQIFNIRMLHFLSVKFLLLFNFVLFYSWFFRVTSLFKTILYSSRFLPNTALVLSYLLGSINFSAGTCYSRIATSRKIILTVKTDFCPNTFHDAFYFRKFEIINGLGPRPGKS